MCYQAFNSHTYVKIIFLAINQLLTIYQGVHITYFHLTTVKLVNMILEQSGEVKDLNFRKCEFLGGFKTSVTF